MQQILVNKKRLVFEKVNVEAGKLYCLETKVIEHL